MAFSQHNQTDITVLKYSDWLACALPGVRENLEKLSVRTVINSRESERKGGSREGGRESEKEVSGDNYTEHCMHFIYTRF